MSRLLVYRLSISRRPHSTAVFLVGRGFSRAGSGRGNPKGSPYKSISQHPLMAAHGRVENAALHSFAEASRESTTHARRDPAGCRPRRTEHARALRARPCDGRRAGVRPDDGRRRDAVAIDWTVPRRPHQGDHRRPRPAERVLHGAGQRRRVEDQRFRPHLDADLRRPADRIDWRDCGRALRIRT